MAHPPLKMIKSAEIPFSPLFLTSDPDVHEKLMTIKLAYSQLTKCPELKENPFRKRICKIFSTDNSGDLSFNDFMLLFSRYLN